MSTKPKRHAIYRRVSTGAQTLLPGTKKPGRDNQENSMEIQEAKCLAYAKAMNHGEDPLIFSDPGTSGGISIWERTGGSALIRSIESGECGCITIAKFDRIGRRARDWHNFSDFIERHHVEFHIVDLGGAPLAAHGFAGKMLLGILAQMAEFELDMIRTRTIDTMNKLFANGKCIGTIPYGWNLEDDGTLSPNEAELQVIIRMQQWRAAGAGFQAIATRLNREGIPTKRGAGVEVKRGDSVLYVTSGLWSYTTVKKVLESRHVREKLSPEISGAIDTLINIA